MPRPISGCWPSLTLAIVLFTDAANADLARIRRAAGLPERLLLIGLPLTLILGFAVAAVLFPGLGWIEMALLPPSSLPPTPRSARRSSATRPSPPTPARR